MKKISRFFMPSSLAVIAFAHATAQNPIIQTNYTTDPTPIEYHDSVFLYTGLAENDALGFKMLGWLLYTSTDMVNWPDHGDCSIAERFQMGTLHNRVKF